MKILRYFSKEEWFLWSGSVLMILISFWGFKQEDYLSLVASLIGVSSLIFNAKGNAIGQVLMILFSILYGIISYSFAYYGEMITYLGMTLPMAVVALIAWLKNPYKGRRAEVAVNRIRKGEYFLLLALTAIITFAFYFILALFHTANLFFSTLSVATSFIAAYLTFRRSPYFALAYGANDIVLIVLWLLATLDDFSYLSVVICFIAFLVNDLYGFINWRRMELRQRG